MNFRRAVATAALLVGASVFACSASEGEGGHADPDGDGGSADASGEGGSADASGDGDGSDGDGSDGDAGEAGSACELSCSADLRTVLLSCANGTSSVIETCAPEQGCARGACVPACEAAKEAATSLGCEFSAVSPTVIDGNDGRGACFAAFIANASPVDVIVSAEYDGNALDVTKSMFRIGGGVFTPLNGNVPSGTAAVVFLSQGNGGACPAGVTPALRSDPSIHTSGRTTRSFRLKTTAPVSAYAMYPFGGAAAYVPTATLLLPVESLGTEYVIVNPAPRFSQGSSDPFTQLVATEDDTVVTLVPSANIVSAGGLQAGSAGVPYTVTMSRGEVVQLVQSAELTGTPLSSNKQLAVLGGHQCMVVPADVSACDAAQQQLPAVTSWGTEYAAASYRSRSAGTNETLHYRIVSAVAGTTLTYTPDIPSAPHSLGAGEVASFDVDVPFVVRSQDAKHPIFVASFMTGGTLAGGAGDPDFVNVVPTAQYLSSYTFYADHSFAETSLTFIRKRGPAGFANVELDCAGNIGGWSALGTDFEVARVDLSRGHLPVATPTGSCAPGRHVARSAEPFALTVWGWGPYASYGYPAGSGTRHIYAP